MSVSLDTTGELVTRAPEVLFDAESEDGIEPGKIDSTDYSVFPDGHQSASGILMGVKRKFGETHILDDGECVA